MEKSDIILHPTFQRFERYEPYAETESCTEIKFQLEVYNGKPTPRGGGGCAWPTNIRGSAAGKSKKLPCPGVKFPKMIHISYFFSYKYLCTMPYQLLQKYDKN